MQIEQLHWTQSSSWQYDANMRDAELVLVFGAPQRLDGVRLSELRKFYPEAILFGSSTSGEIAGTHVFDDSIAVVAIKFNSTKSKLVCTEVEHAGESHAAGMRLAKQLLNDDLVHIFVLSDGLHVNGTELVNGFKEVIPAGINISGGLAGDDTRFERTLIVANEEIGDHNIAALGLYGTNLRIGCGSLGGWDAFGPERLITKSDGNVLFELDGASALALYKRYLGEHASGLPSTGLLFPLALRTTKHNDGGLVRTILSVDEENQSMTFAGDVPEGAYVRLMKANFDRLVDGAVGAATTAIKNLRDSNPELAILISCVGRKLVLKQRVEEEVEAVQDVLGIDTMLTGFYSYGEISPYATTGHCELHNQTMTITTLSEA